MFECELMRFVAWFHDIWEELRGPARLNSQQFLIRFVPLCLFAVIVFVWINRLRVSTRLDADVWKDAPLFFGWFLLSIAIFYLLSQWLIQYWTFHWLGADDPEPNTNDRSLPRSLSFSLRMLLLSPVLAHGVLVTTLVLPAVSGAFNQSQDRKKWLVVLLVSFCLVSVGLTSRLPKTLTGLKDAQFQKSVQPLDPQLVERIPSESRTDVVFLSLTPSLRYLAWMSFDFIRARQGFWALQDGRLPGCEGMGQAVGVSASGCLYHALKASADAAQFVSPIFPLMYLTQARSLQVQAEGQAAQSIFVSESSKTQANNDRASVALEEWVSSIDQQLQLMEPASGITRNRKTLLWPIWIPVLTASPELPLVEFGQDFQRRSLFKRLEPLLQMQIDAATKQLSTLDHSYVQSHSSLQTRLIGLRARLAVLKRDPTGIATATN